MASPQVAELLIMRARQMAPRAVLDASSERLAAAGSNLYGQEENLP